jgi:glutamyl-tRNA reductase
MNNIWVLAASADFAGVEERARLAHAMERWVGVGHAGIALVTCHRAELYGFGEPPGLDSTLFHNGNDAVRHLMRVGAGLESAIVGEDEVLHQVRQALHRAQRERAVDYRLRRLFESAVAIGRRARSRRTKSGGSLARRVVDWMQTQSDIDGRMVVVAGAGHMGAALGHLLAGAGACVSVASRDGTRAVRLARVYGGRGMTLVDGAQLVRSAAAVAVALGGPWCELAALEAHDLPPVADISAPQAVPDSVRHALKGRFLGIDALYERAEEPPRAYIKDAEALVERGTSEYSAWLRARPS